MAKGTGRFCALMVFVWLEQYQLHGESCFPSKTAFVTDCQNTYHGFVHGGRCFFIGNYPNYTITAWPNAWSVCSAQGATLAQIHTSLEMKAIASYLVPLLKGAFDAGTIWIAGGRDPTATNTTGYAIDMKLTRYYDSASTWNPLLTANNTFLRLHWKDDKFVPNSNCLHMWGTYTTMCDQNCSYPMFVLCQNNNLLQNFTLVAGKCMREVVITLYSSSTTVEDCANKCAGQVWCRSFNWYQIAQKCELFPWYHVDTTNTASGVTDCYHYTYVP